VADQASRFLATRGFGRVDVERASKSEFYTLNLATVANLQAIH